MRARARGTDQETNIQKSERSRERLGETKREREEEINAWRQLDNESKESAEKSEKSESKSERKRIVVYLQ